MDEKRVRAVYEELGRYEIELASDPISLGPKYLQEIIALCRNYMNQATKLLMEVNLEKQLLTRVLNALQVAYDVDADNLLANDERVRRLPNIKDRESTVKVLLRDQLRVIATRKAEVNDLTCVEKAVKHKHGELKETMDAIKMQKSLIAAEITTGAMYGDERGMNGGSRRSAVLTPPEMLDDDEVLALIGETEPKESPVLAEPEPTPKTVTDRVMGATCTCSDSKYPHLHDEVGTWGDILPQLQVAEESKPALVDKIEAISAFDAIGDLDLEMDPEVARFLNASTLSSERKDTSDDDFSSLLP